MCIRDRYIDRRSSRGLRCFVMMTTDIDYTFRCCSRGVQKCIQERRWPKKDCFGARFFSTKCKSGASQAWKFHLILTLLLVAAWCRTIKDFATKLFMAFAEASADVLDKCRILKFLSFELLVIQSYTCHVVVLVGLMTLSRSPANLWDIMTVSLILLRRLCGNSSKRC